MIFFFFFKENPDFFWSQKRTSNHIKSYIARNRIIYLSRTNAGLRSSLVWPHCCQWRLQYCQPEAFKAKLMRFALKKNKKIIGLGEKMEYFICLSLEGEDGPCCRLFSTTLRTSSVIFAFTGKLRFLFDCLHSGTGALGNKEILTQRMIKLWKLATPR